MADVRQYRQDPQINHGTTAQSNLKLTDIMPVQHENLATQTNSINKISLAQCLCEPYAVCNSNNPSSGNYTATCENFPDFALSYTDSQGNSHNLIGLKVRVKFTHGITYGSVSGGTYPTLNINGSGAVPLLAQGKTMATGAVSAGQTIEFTIIPYGNGVAFDADSNVRESTSDYTIYTDGLKRQNSIDTSKNLPTCNAVLTKLDSYTKLVYFNMYNIPANVTYQEQLQLAINTLISEGGRYRVTVMLSYAVSAPKEIGIYYKIGDTVYQMAYTTKSDFPSGESSLNMVSICASAMINEQANTNRGLIIKTSTQSTVANQTNPMYIFIERLRDL